MTLFKILKICIGGDILQLNILNSINNLNENKIKGCKYEGIEDEGGCGEKDGFIGMPNMKE